MFKENPKDYNPEMHSAEHILNQTMVRMFNCGRAFSAHIEKKKSKCDYHFERDLTQQEKDELESNVNSVIAEHLPVTERFITKEEAQTEFNLSRLPEGAGETIRIVSIGQYDHCPCSGVHVENTSEIGTFKVISSDYNDGTLRLRFKVIKPQ